MNVNSVSKILLTLIPNSFRVNIELTWIKIGIGIKIVQITDTHIHKFSPYESMIIKIIQDLKPDIVVHTGDMIDEKGDLDACKKFLSNIKAKYKVAVLGNHDHWRGEKEVIRCAEESDFIVLKDEKINLMDITFTGIDWDDNKDWKYHVAKTNPDGIILSHSPDIAPFIHSGLVLSGHTHGGIGLSQRFTLYTNSKYGFSRGLYKIGNVILYVSRGLGYVLLPARPFSVPEIVILS